MSEKTHPFQVGPLQSYGGGQTFLEPPVRVDGWGAPAYDYSGGRQQQQPGGPSGFLSQQWQNAGPSGRAAGIIGAGMGLMSMFGRRSGPSRYEVEQEGLARSGMGAADSYAGMLGSMGQGLQTQGLHNQNMYRDRYMDTLTNPANMQMDMASLAAQDSARQRGISSRFGLMGGNLGAANAMRSAYNPGMASGVAGLMNQRRQGLASAYGYGANAAANDFSQGMGMLGNSYNVANAGRQNMGSVLGRLQASSDARRAASDQAMMGAVKGIGSLAGGGFG